MARTLQLLAVVLCGLTACVGSLTKAHPPRYFEVRFPYQPTSCPAPARPEILRIWPLSASAPFNQEPMAILDPSRQVRFSTGYRWITQPGEMVANLLVRDLSRDGHWAQVLPGSAPAHSPVELGGTIFDFGWEQSGSVGRAVLDLEITVWREAPKREILFQKHYHFESPSSAESSAEGFAAAMSGLVQELSRQLREDLCLSSTGSSSPAAG